MRKEGWFPRFPCRGPCSSWDERPCRLASDHDRERKTGPCFPIRVMRCRVHGHGFTLYPPGHVPYGRKRLAAAAVLQVLPSDLSLFERLAESGFVLGFWPTPLLCLGAGRPLRRTRFRLLGTRAPLPGHLAGAAAGKLGRGSGPSSPPSGWPAPAGTGWRAAPGQCPQSPCGGGCARLESRLTAARLFPIPPPAALPIPTAWT